VSQAKCQAGTFPIKNLSHSLKQLRLIMFDGAVACSKRPGKLLKVTAQQFGKSASCLKDLINGFTPRI